MYINSMTFLKGAILYYTQFEYSKMELLINVIVAHIISYNLNNGTL